MTSSSAPPDSAMSALNENAMPASSADSARKPAKRGARKLAWSVASANASTENTQHVSDGTVGMPYTLPSQNTGVKA